MEEQKDLPKPQTDLPKPELEIPAHSGGKRFSIPNFFRLPVILLIPLILLILLALVGGAYLLGKNNATSDNQTPTGSPKPTAQAADPTADWKIFTENGFTFKYPSSWKYKINTNATAGDPTITGTRVDFGRDYTQKEIDDGERIYKTTPAPDALVLQMSLFFNTDKKSQNYDTRNFATTIDTLETKSLIVGEDIQATQYIWGCQATCVDVAFKQNGMIFDFSVNNFDDQSINILNQILSTFKFTDSADVSPTPTKEGVACTQDAMQCPDGSWVGRSGPNCQFDCPK